MSRSRVLTIVALTLAGGALASPTGAIADGLPISGGLDTTSQGVLNSSGAQRFVAVSDGESTLVARIATGTGQLLRTSWVGGRWSVPGVAVDGDTSGISRNGAALVLIRPRTSFPQRETSLALIDPESLSVEQRYTLDGDFSFDAISPDGSTAFLIEYPDPRDRTLYRLRTLDLSTGRLAPGSLLPENNPDEAMRGMPLARATGPEGRWEFTLYDGGRLYPYGRGEPGEPFVHAIDMVERRTLCIDLDWPMSRRVLDRVQLQMSEDGKRVEVVDPGVETLGTVDVATGEASEGEPAAAPSEPAEESGLWPGLALLPIAMLALVVAGLFARRRDT